MSKIKNTLIMKFFLQRVILSTLLVLSYIGNAQNENISLEGFVKDNNSNVVSSAHVSLKGTNFKTVTNNEGFYRFTKLPADKYTLFVSYVGKKTVKRKVDIIKGNKTTLNIVLENNIESLDEVLVSGKKGSPVTKRESSYVARLPIKNIENPQVYITVSDELMEKQLVTDFDAAFKNVVGAGIPVKYNQNRLVFYSRGFEVEPKIRNGLTTFNQNAIDPVNLERIEVLKGPSATLFGSSEVSYGGLLNRVTKKPYEGFGGSVAYSGGSWNLNRLTVDINTPVNESKTVLFRLNGAVHGEKSFQDAGFTNNIAFTPSLTYKINDKTQLNFDVEYTKTRGTSPVRHTVDTGDIANRSALDFIDYYNVSYASNDIFYTGENLDIFGELKYKLSENWTSSTSFARTQTSSDGYTSRIDGRSATTFRARVYNGHYGYNSTNLQQNFTGKFNFGTIKNKLVVGINYYNYGQDRDVTFINTSDFEYGSADYYNEFNKSYIDTQMADGSRTLRNQTTHTYSAYVSDVVNFTDNLSVMLSLRFDHFNDKGTYDILTGTLGEGFSQNALSPKLGLVYQILPEQLAVFGNCMNGFANQSGTSENGNSFNPEHANQIEGGVKFDIFKNKLSGSVSYYDIKVENIVREDPNDSDFDIQDGTQTSKGLEIEFIANPIKDFNVLMGFAYNESELQNTEDGEQDGLRPERSGPDKLFNWWMDYNVLGKSKNKLLIGLGGNTGSSSFQTNTVNETVTIPSYTVLDFGVTYEVDSFSFGIKANNLTDEQYWSYRLAPQKSRNFVANFAYNF